MWQLYRAGYRIVNFVHDEIVIEVPAGPEAQEHAAKIRQTMVEAMKRVVPDVAVDVDVAILDCWSKQSPAPPNLDKPDAAIDREPVVSNSVSTQPSVPSNPEKADDGVGRNGEALGSTVLQDAPPGKVAVANATHLPSGGFIVVNPPASIENPLGGLRHRDCIEGLAQLPARCVDLGFADPPFNIGYEYDVYQDRRTRPEYLSWCDRWLAEMYRVLKPSGTFWLAIGDEYVADLALLCQKIGFYPRSWVTWYYTFGVNCERNFSRSHAHLLYFVKDPKNFTFRVDDLDNRVQSARQSVYADKRANPRGRLPDNTWIYRPQDASDCFTPLENTWYYPRVAGTFKERQGFHSCQMPEQVVGRIIRFCSNKGELVLDPFSGSATTLVVAKKLGRRYLGFEISEDYVRRGLARLEQAHVGDPLEGASNPLISAPATPEGKPVRQNRKTAPVQD